MWSKTYSVEVKGVSAESMWRVWKDVDAWHTWQDDVDYAKLQGPFTAGSSFLLKPKGGPKVRIALLEVEENKRFVDLTKFPLAKMQGIHEFLPREDAIEIRTTVTVEGWLGFLWKKLVAEGVAESLEAQTASLVTHARRLASAAQPAA